MYAHANTLQFIRIGTIYKLTSNDTLMIHLKVSTVDGTGSPDKIAAIAISYRVGKNLCSLYGSCKTTPMDENSVFVCVCFFLFLANSVRIL